MLINEPNKEIKKEINKAMREIEAGINKTFNGINALIRKAKTNKSKNDLVMMSAYLDRIYKKLKNLKNRNEFKK